MHHTTLTYLQAARAFDRSSLRDNDCLGESYGNAFHAWHLAGYPDADPGPEADLRTELEAAVVGERDRCIAIARGCKDYKGGHNGELLEVFWHGIDTVVSALSAKRDTMQIRVLEAIGRESNGTHTEDHAAATTPEAYRGVVADAVAEELERLRAEIEIERGNHAISVRSWNSEVDDLRARLQAMHRRAQGAEAERDTLAQRLGEREAELRIAREEHAELRALADGLRERRDAAHAEAAAWRRIAGDNAESAAHWRTVAEALAARPRLRDRLRRWMGGAL